MPPRAIASLRLFKEEEDEEQREAAAPSTPPRRVSHENRRQLCEEEYDGRHVSESTIERELKKRFDDDGDEDDSCRQTPSELTFSLGGDPDDAKSEDWSASSNAQDWWPDDEDLGRGPEIPKELRVANHEWLVATLGRVRQGDAEAMYVLGNEYRHPKTRLQMNTRRAKRLFELAAVQGHAKALQELGTWYEQGLFGNCVDENRALQFYTRAAETGDAGAQEHMASLYYHGRCGLEVDYEVAARWLDEAAVRGHPEALAQLGRCLVEGRGVKRDLNAAFQKFTLAENAGSQVAQKWARDLETMLLLHPDFLATPSAAANEHGWNPDPPPLATNGHRQYRDHHHAPITATDAAAPPTPPMTR